MANVRDSFFNRKGSYSKEKDYIPLNGTTEEQLIQGRTMRGYRVRSADEVINIKKEPIAVDLEIHYESPDQRNIRQAPIGQLNRKITIPKSHLDLYNSSCVDDVIHIKSLDEMERERIVLKQVELERQKHLNKIAALSRDYSRKAGRSVKQQAFRQTSAPVRKLISSSVIEARMDNAEGDVLGAAEDEIEEVTPSHPRIFVDLAVAESTDDAPTRATRFHRDRSPISFPGDTHSTGHKKHHSEKPYHVTQAHNGTAKFHKRAWKGKHKQNGRSRALQNVAVNNLYNQQMPAVTDSNSRCVVKSGSHLHNGGSSGSSGTSQDDSSGGSPVRCKLPTTLSITQRRSPIYNSPSSGQHLPPATVTSGPPSPTGSRHHVVSASSFWQRNSKPSSDQDLSRFSMERLSRFSDSLDGVGLSSTPFTAGQSLQRRHIVNDLLNVSQEELDMLEVSRNIKLEPANPTTYMQEPGTPESMSDDDIIWDDEEEVEGEIHQSDEQVLEIHTEEDIDNLSEEFLLDKADQLML